MGAQPSPSRMLLLGPLLAVGSLLAFAWAMLLVLGLAGPPPTNAKETA